MIGTPLPYMVAPDTVPLASIPIYGMGAGKYPVITCNNGPIYDLIMDPFRSSKRWYHNDDPNIVHEGSLTT